MEDQEEDNLDGSSIKPVSSLRSHFEQMAKSTLKTTAAPPRPISPKPKFHGADPIMSNNTSAGGAGQSGLRPPISNGHANLPLSPSLSRQRPPSTGPMVFPPVSPAVTIEPPSSQPKTINLNLALASPSAFLTTDGPSSTSGSSSPRHFRIPSRPHTPLLEARKTPGIPAVQPPGPPPPRRSTELRRENTLKSTIAPPPVNRAEKPKITNKQPLRGHHVELAPEYGQNPNDKASPFSTPPSSDSSPGLDPLPPRPLSRASSTIFQPYVRSPTPVQIFDPPPIHHSFNSLRKDVDGISQGQSIIQSQATGDHREQRPALPVRPSPDGSSSTSARVSLDTHRPYKTSSTPIDTLRSSNSGVSISRTSDIEFSVPALPKRNFSTPVSQLQPPPRTHGRSMTVDQTSDRMPAEFRTVEKAIPAPMEHNDKAVIPKLGTTGMVTPPNAVDYPDPSLSNRRPPHFKQGIIEILTKFDARVFDVCGEYVCASGHHTRVWNLHDGEQVLSLSHGETVKVLSLAFKPTKDPGHEGSRLWLGNNVGELIELNITAQSPIIATNNAAHNRREILKIYRHINDMWTLDESGTLNVWASDRAGPPHLEIPSATYRVPKGHTYSIVVNDELWYATGSDIRIFVPTVEGKSQFQLLLRPLSQPGVGEITSGAVIGSQPDKVYFGHSDGKVSIYSAGTYSCLGTVNVSMYKINSLAGVGAYLWAAYNTGMIYIYDTRETPWLVKKEWRAHFNPVISVSVDRAGFWKMGRSQILSLGADDTLKVWDGLLEEDWLETELQTQDERYCKLDQIKALVMTWNAGASTPHSLRYTEQDKNFLPNLLKESKVPDILIFNFQELVDLEDKKTTAKSFFSKSKKKDPSEPEHMSHQYRDWRDYLIRCLDDSMPREELYHLLSSDSLVGLFTCIFVRARLRDRIKGVSAAEVKRGMGGRAGNKGALILRFMVDDTSLCFINCHLAAGQTQTKDRNFDVSSILDSTILPIEERDNVRLDSYIGGGDGTMILDHEICILSGDLNYRIDTMSRDAVINALNSGKIIKLLERDQLLASKRKRPGFRLRAFHEMPITFAPTYKYDVGSDNYDTSEKKRAPAWCDRILSRGRDQKRLKQLDYRRHEVRVSDHRPVTGLFQMTVKSISPEKRAMVWVECIQKLEEVKQRVGDSANIDFLMNICGLDSESCRKSIAEKRKALQ